MLDQNNTSRNHDGWDLVQNLYNTCKPRATKYNVEPEMHMYFLPNAIWHYAGNILALRTQHVDKMYM